MFRGILMKCGQQAGLLVPRQGVANTKVDSNAIVFSEKVRVGYSPAKMFQVVSDVESYHKFVPYCRKSVVTQRKQGRLAANLVVGFKPFLNLSYTSHVTLIEPYLVTAVCKDVRIFEHLKTVWKISPLIKEDPNACEVDFAVSFAFKSESHSVVSKMFLDSIVRQNVKAFVNRAENIFGPPSRPSQREKSIVVNS